MLKNKQSNRFIWSTVHFIFHNTIQYRRTAAMSWQLYWNQDSDSYNEQRH